MRLFWQPRKQKKQFNIQLRIGDVYVALMIQPGFSPFGENKKAVIDHLFQKCNKYLYNTIASSYSNFSFSPRSAALPTSNGTKCCLKYTYMYTCTDTLLCKRQSSQVSFLSPVLPLVLKEETITCFPWERKSEAI